jgi:alpha-glucosidase
MSAWWRGAVFYQIYPRSFRDTGGDGVGDLPGITEKLDHVAALGADAVWISPISPSPMKDFGYDVSDYRGIDPLFGTLDDFDRLLARAHALGLKVIVDLVISHSSDRHPWFHQSRADPRGPYGDWYVWADPRPGGGPPNNWLAVFGGSAWTWDGIRGQFYLHNFLVEQPDLNFHNPAVQDEILDIVRFWLDRGLDGFRLDTANFYFHDPKLRDNPPPPAGVRVPGDAWADNPYFGQRHLYDKSQPEALDFLRRLRAVVDGYPDRMLVGEIGDDEPVLRTAEYVQAGLLHTAYNFSLLGPHFSPAFIERTVTAFAAAAGEGWPSWAFSNHDVKRAVSRWHGEHEPRFARMLVALLIALRGTVFLYQGEELGLAEAEIPRERLVDPYGIAFWPAFKGRDGCRTPMPWTRDAPHGGFSTAEPWLPMPDAHRAMAVDVQASDAASTLSAARALLRWRRDVPALREGGIAFRPAPADVLLFERSLAGDRILCAFNLGHEHRTLTVREAVEITPTDLGGRLADEQLTLAPRGAAFARLR